MIGGKKRFTVKPQSTSLTTGSSPPFVLMCHVSPSVAKLLRSSPNSIEILHDKIIVTAKGK
eukprot:CAMPEP_0184361568 /NCGR_PEP_ID=MMETSP1089-20130417/130907_1 /TAXON_ID=38269 ORGANISM="Gloeochaete wittrockiana, Strain SAG46.84" /NCGR_SAMPLE_ID=MMETSP1089 /ASSEMBLY_ACC=CAM_ASM_000445 /LENGTH=60 /DNA_ID=CAMNT_0026701295 /DNA_START=159 /DNA_END=338 /DNA_ORIENTATION=-